MKKAAKKSSRGPALKKSAKKGATAAKRPAKAPAKRSSGGRKSGSALSRVTRVAKEVAHQATTAVSEGVETIKEFGEGIVDRVTG
jgi:hypothetical protein